MRAEVLKEADAARVLDLGCGNGRLLQSLLREGQFERVVGVDVSFPALERAARRLRLQEMSPKQRERIELAQSSLTHEDRHLQGYDAAAVVEVIEHLDPSRLDAFERALFGVTRPGTVVLTTPNAEYNVRFETSPPDRSATGITGSSGPGQSSMPGQAARRSVPAVIESRIRRTDET